MFLKHIAISTEICLMKCTLVRKILNLHEATHPKKHKGGQSCMNTCFYATFRCLKSTPVVKYLIFDACLVHDVLLV